ncbi:MmcQ/YjbR family DNA-binding protein [Mucilaginibacter psychrotolerans]|uniref:MmcQ/YjbR family DNA-binding protein n=1 Tax=Mucilaginibacter psychrotolerans TaxID=1524096 RepID=A0A4Y8S8A1_9SPHI|nr:MmcQ/YjbR family DNA-binding protein [Mucilaginibacter psychrotolerans]TFF34664.1 MmcQ/YjbR family DNA-binding protein [Mucilaginibacter psychrotolerans]
MTTTVMLRQTALSLPAVTEEPHFDKISFKIAKKIFATLNEMANRATVKLSPADQDIFCLADSNGVYPVPNKWGKLGWMHIDLDIAKPEMCAALLKVAYCEVAPKKYAVLISFDE